MNCKDIVVKYLKDNNYDGLVHCEVSCGCGFKEDTLFCCGEDISECEPAYSVKSKCEDCDIHGEHSECYDPDGTEKTCYTINK